MRSNTGKTATIYQIPGCVNEAFMSAMTLWYITFGFRSSGISPYNRDIFSDQEFEPSMVTDRSAPELQSAAADDPPIASTSITAELLSPCLTHGCASPSETDLDPSHTTYVKFYPYPKV